MGGALARILLLLCLPVYTPGYDALPLQLPRGVHGLRLHILLLLLHQQLRQDRYRVSKKLGRVGMAMAIMLLTHYLCLVARIQME